MKVDRSKFARSWLDILYSEGLCEVSDGWGSVRGPRHTESMRHRDDHSTLEDIGGNRSRNGRLRRPLVEFGMRYATPAGWKWLD